MPAFDADEVNLKSWQLVTAIHHAEGEGLTLCEQLSEGYDHMCVTFKVLSWRILCNVTYICRINILLLYF